MFRFLEILCLSGLFGLAFAQSSFHVFSNFENVKLENGKNFVSDSASQSLETNLAAHNDESHGKMWIYYETFDLNKARAEITDAPFRENAKALHYHINEANVLKNGKKEKSRIQMEFKKKPGFKSFVNEVDIFLPKEMEVINSIRKPIKRFGLQEYWNDPVNLGGSTFSISVGMVRKHDGKMHMKLSSRDYYDSKFHTVDYFENEAWLVPFGKWFTLKTEIKEGDESDGHVKLSVKMSDEDDYTVLVDTTARTMSRVYASKQKKPHGFTSLHALKLYTSKELLEWMSDLDATLDVYYANWKFDGETY